MDGVKIMEAIKGLDNTDVIDLWNEYVKDKNIPDDRIYKNGEAEAFFNGMFSSPYDAVLAVTSGKYNECEKYIAFDNYDVVTFDFWDDSDSPVDIYALVGWLMENPEKAKEYGIEDE